MVGLRQLAAIFAIAAGAGLFAFGRHLDPPLSAANPGAMMSANSHNHESASFACGWGIAFMTLGGLLLVVPWINDCVTKQTTPGPV
jgi:hypothetical protein